MLAVCEGRDVMYRSDSHITLPYGPPLDCTLRRTVEFLPVASAVINITQSIHSAYKIMKIGRCLSNL